MSTLQIIATSWPFATIALSIVVGSVILLAIRQMRKWDMEDKAYRANQAKDVTRYE